MVRVLIALTDLMHPVLAFVPYSVRTPRGLNPTTQKSFLLICFLHYLFAMPIIKKISASMPLPT